VPSEGYLYICKRSRPVKNTSPRTIFGKRGYEDLTEYRDTGDVTGLRVPEGRLVATMRPWPASAPYARCTGRPRDLSSTSRQRATFLAAVSRTTVSPLSRA
jgi:hypothetical protein